jgi:hypothetical protein
MKIEAEILLQSLRETLTKDSRSSQIAVLLYLLLAECAISDETIVQIAVNITNLVS